MAERICVRPGYTVDARYITVEADEMLCVECGGTGEVRLFFGAPGGDPGMFTCRRCNGDGKLKRSCRRCGMPHRIVAHHSEHRDLDVYCSECVFARVREQMHSTGGWP